MSSLCRIGSSRFPLGCGTVRETAALILSGIRKKRIAGAPSSGRSARARCEDMDSILALALALVIPKEGLRFSAVFEQEADLSCGLAAAASVLALYCSIPADEAFVYTLIGGTGRGAGRGIALGDIGHAFSAVGVSSRAFRMDDAQLERALELGFAPIVVRYDRPSPHFALLLGSGSGPFGEFFAMADPARGIEALSRSDFDARWCGAALLVEGSALSPGGRSLLAAAMEGCLAREELAARSIAARLALRAAFSEAFP